MLNFLWFTMPLRMLWKKAIGSDKKKQMVEYMQDFHQLSQRHACKVVKLPRSSFAYSKVGRIKDDPIIEALTLLVDKHPSIGFWKCYHRLRRAGHLWNHKRVYRVYKTLKLNIRRKRKRRLPHRERRPLVWPGTHNDSWSMDFMSDSLYSGFRYRVLNVIDDHNRECLAMEVDTSISARRVTRTLDQIAEWRGLPASIRVDNGPEFTSTHLEVWCEENDVKLTFIRPGKPTENSYIERFNRTVREDLLDVWLFNSLNQVREQAHEFMVDYNRERPHETLGNITPVEFALNIANCSGALDRPLKPQAGLFIMDEKT